MICHKAQAQNTDAVASCRNHKHGKENQAVAHGIKDEKTVVGVLIDVLDSTGAEVNSPLHSLQFFVYGYKGRLRF